MSSTRRHNSPRGGLGRGLGALIPSGPADPADPAGPPPAGPATRPADIATSPTGRRRPPPSAAVNPAERLDPVPAAVELRPVPGARMIEIAVTDVRANAQQPRTVFDDDALAELSHSIREFGVLQPIVVREVAGSATRFELVMGERRLRAAAAAGLDRIPAIVRETADEAMLRDALLENIHRAALNPLEEAAAYQQLLQEFGVTHEELARRIGRSRSLVSNTIRLLNLPVGVQRRVAAGVLSAGHARALLGLAHGVAQEELATRIVAEGLSVRATEELVTLADHATRAPAARRPTRTFTAPALGELAENLSDVLDTRVRVELGRRKGKITVEFATIDDLERIVAVMAPKLATRRPAVQDDPKRP